MKGNVCVLTLQLLSIYSYLWQHSPETSSVSYKCCTGDPLLGNLIRENLSESLDPVLVRGRKSSSLSSDTTSNTRWVCFFDTRCLSFLTPILHTNWMSNNSILTLILESMEAPQVPSPQTIHTRVLKLPTILPSQLQIQGSRDPSSD